MPEENDDFKIMHNIVYSVKGGCGKTSFSLFLTLSNLFFDGEIFSLGKIVNSEIGGPPVLDGERSVSNYMLDMDFLGTILMDTVGIDRENAAGIGVDGTLVTMPGIIFDGQKIREVEEPNRAGKGSGEKYIIYSSHHELDKEKFHVKRENTPLLKYDDFRYEIRNIQKDIELTARSKKGDISQLNMIYDMPPNSDGYTDAFLNEMTEIAGRKHRDGEREQKVVLYLLFNSSSTLHCNIEWLKRFQCSRNPEGIEYVFVNCNSYMRADYREVISGETVEELLKDSEIESLEFYFYDFAYSEKVSVFNDDPSRKRGTRHLLEEYLYGYEGADTIEKFKPGKSKKG